MTPDEAADLAARTLAAIDAMPKRGGSGPDEVRDYFRERVTSDLAGLRDCWANEYPGWIAHRDRYADGLRRTARLYGCEASK